MPATASASAPTLGPVFDDRTQSILEHRRRSTKIRRRGWLMRRILLAADALGLAVAFVAVELFFGSRGSPDPISLTEEFILFVPTLPLWLLGAKLFGLYDRDEERADNSTADELARVLLLSTVGAFFLIEGFRLTGLANPDLVKIGLFWALAIVLVAASRIAARTFARRSIAYLQNTVIVGAGDVGQLVARRLLQHREYGINLVGFVDAQPKEQRPDLEHLTILGSPGHLREIVEAYGVDRVVFAFSNESHTESLELIRSLRDSGVRVDLVPRLFEIIGPKIEVHSVEGIPLIGLSPVRIPRSSQAIKRSIDVAGALVALVVTLPLFPLVALLIKRDSPGPVFFRQTRLGKDMREFTLLKFRTMRADTDDAPHRRYIAATTESSAPLGSNGLFKLDRSDAVTKVGRWLRKTSLDELPQLLNVLRGDMSLVGPRPCLPYEVQHFAPHHFERFLVPAGLTGLWQVRARAYSTFGEALDLDVLYAHSWSLGLDLSLLARTPLQFIRSGGTA
jgi:exopolysaccharide biosynthesis polyprenyl glycosylphosphotransferase